MAMAIHDIHVLKDGGFSEQQAMSLARYVEQTQGHLVTKPDLEIAVLRVTAEIKESKVDMLRWGAGMFVAQLAAALGLCKILFSH
jgi:hypothetical protein